MLDFKAPKDDIIFTLEHAAGGKDLEDWDSELVDAIVTQFGEFAEEVIAPTDENGDVEGCRLEDGRVYTPKGFKEAYEQLAANGWQGLVVPEEYGGQGLGALVNGAVSEIFSGANHSLQMVTNLVPGAVETIYHKGTEKQKEEYLPKLASGEWLSTMCLTEANAGSDLSQIRCRATKVGNHWEINGEKIFISGGDQDLSEGILHLVLARTGALEEGTKGLSLFLCLSEVDGETNPIKVTRIEEKMGLHGSPTCQMAFDDAKAELIGEEGKGLETMFVMMNHARLDVALQGVAHASRATDLARGYAAERVQGKNANHELVTIDQHPDVIRMINEIDAMALGSRCMVHITMVEIEKATNPELVEFLTPVCKSFCTAHGVQSADKAIQVMGGYGYMREYRAEQNVRDARICSIYEGTNGIHAITLATRLLKWKDGAAADAFAAFIAKEARHSSHLRRLHNLWTEARFHVSESEHPREIANEFAELTGAVFYQAAWSRLRSVADHAADPQRIRDLARLAEIRSDAFASAWRSLVWKDAV